MKCCGISWWCRSQKVTKSHRLTWNAFVRLSVCLFLANEWRRWRWRRNVVLLKRVLTSGCACWQITVDLCASLKRKCKWIRILKETSLRDEIVYPLQLFSNKFYSPHFSWTISFVWWQCTFLDQFRKWKTLMINEIICQF